MSVTMQTATIKRYDKPHYDKNYNKNYGKNQSYTYVALTAK